MGRSTYKTPRIDNRLYQIVQYVEESGRHAEHLDAIRAYRDEFGIAPPA